MTDEPWAWLGEGIRDRLEDLDLGEARAYLVGLLVDTGPTGIIEDRRLLASALFDTAANYFTADGHAVHLSAFGPAMPQVALDAAERIASVAGGDDALWRLAAELISTQVADIARVASGIGHWKSFGSAFPPVIKLGGDPESVSTELQRALPLIHNRLWHTDRQVVSEEPMQLEVHDDFPMAEVYDNFPMAGNAIPGDRYTIDPWLEVRSDTGEPGLPDLFNPLGGGEWHRVRHSVVAAARLIEDEANRVAPSFVQEQGKIGVAILPVSLWGTGWGTGRARIRATFAELGEDPRDLRVLGAGTARWVAAAISLACRRLEEGHQLVTGQDGAVISDEAARREAVTHARAAPFTQVNIRLDPSDAPAFYIADEPEAHLHPAALQSVRKWLARLAEAAATVLVATHSTALLDSSSELVRRVLVLRDGEVTRLRRLTGALSGELAQVSEDLGITKGELLLMTRLAVFVEGPHDEIILDEWFGDDFRASGIRIFPVHGVDNMPGLADSEIISALGVRIAAISDATTVDRSSPDVPETRGDRAVIRLLDEAARAGIEVRPIGLSEPDILYYLSADVCRQVAPAFPGWQAAQQERTRVSSRTPWKRRIEEEYGLRLNRTEVRRLARACRLQDGVPAELVQVAQALLAHAADAHRQISES